VYVKKKQKINKPRQDCLTCAQFQLSFAIAFSKQQLLAMSIFVIFV